MPTPGVCPLSRLDDPIDITIDVAAILLIYPHLSCSIAYAHYFGLIVLIIELMCVFIDNLFIKDVGRDPTALDLDTDIA